MISASHYACTDCASSCWELLPDSSINIGTKSFCTMSQTTLELLPPLHFRLLHSCITIQTVTVQQLPVYDHMTTQLIWCIEPLCIPLHTNSCTDCKYWLTVSGEDKSKPQQHQQEKETKKKCYVTEICICVYVCTYKPHKYNFTNTVFSDTCVPWGMLFLLAITMLSTATFLIKSTSCSWYINNHNRRKQNLTTELLYTLRVWWKMNYAWDAS